MTLSDRQFMELALRMGRRNVGATADNPSVGCVIVNDGVVVGRGVTAPGGRPHAETRAIAQAGPSAEGSSAFVSLEPCAHSGNTPPCCDALIDAGVRRVTVAIPDPDPRTSGSGIERMKSAGIAVVSGTCRERARADLAGYLARVELGRPWITLKLAVSSDGMLAERPGARTAITGEPALRRGQMMRARSDAILIGAGTLRVDDPMLTCRLPGLERRSPIRIVAGGDEKILMQSNLVVQSTPALMDRAPVWWLTSRPPSADCPMRDAIVCDKTRDGRLDLVSAMERLARRGVGRLLVEGGAALARSFLEAELVDRAILFRSPRELGASGVAAPLERFASGEFVATKTDTLGDDEMTTYERRR